MWGRWETREVGWQVSILLSPLIRRETLYCYSFSNTPQMWCLEMVDVAFESCFGEISFAPMKPCCILLDDFLKCGLEQKFKTWPCSLPKKKHFLNCVWGLEAAHFTSPAKSPGKTKVVPILVLQPGSWPPHMSQGSIAKSTRFWKLKGPLLSVSV